MGVATGVYIGIYTPPPKKKSAQVNFLWGKKWRQNGYSTVLYVHPKKTFIPPKQISGYALDVIKDVIIIMVIIIVMVNKGEYKFWTISKI